MKKKCYKGTAECMNKAVNAVMVHCPYGGRGGEGLPSFFVRLSVQLKME